MSLVPAKLTSRKFWLALGASIYSMFQGSPQWAALSAAAYAFAEMVVDVARSRIPVLVRELLDDEEED